MSQNKQYLCKQHEIGKNNDVFIIIKASISDKKNPRHHEKWLS